LVCGDPLGNSKDGSVAKAFGVGQDQSSWPAACESMNL